MKNLARKSLLVVGLMMSLSIQANDAEIINNEKENKGTNMRFENVQQGSTLIIKDENGFLLFKESIEQTGDYSKTFDLTTLPNGNYYFELNSELKIVVIPFNVNSSEVMLDKESEEFICKPVVRAKDNMVYVSRSGIEKAPLSYKIYYANNYDLVHSIQFDESEEVKKAYDFSAAKKGNYVIVFESNGRKFTKNIKI